MAAFGQTSMHRPHREHSIVAAPLARESAVMAKHSQALAHAPQSLHSPRSTFTRKGLRRPTRTLAGKNGQIRLQ